MRRRIVGPAAAAALTLVLGACGVDANVLGPGDEPEVSNATDTFAWHVSDVSNVSQSLAYTWTNTGTTADVNQAGSMDAGTAMLRVADDEGTQVYARSLDDDGTFRTKAGAAGEWTVTVTLSEASGSAEFRLENPDASP
jgi:hypothetical protein